MNSDTKLKTLIGVNPADTLYLPIDLTKKDATVIQSIKERFAAFKLKVVGFSDVNEKLNLKTGDMVKFIGGYDDNVEFTSEILGFNSEGFAFMLWDCYWFAVDLVKWGREIKIKFHVYDTEKPDAVAIIKDGKCACIKLLVNVPKRFYYSILNDAGKVFEKQYPEYC